MKKHGNFRKHAKYIQDEEDMMSEYSLWQDSLGRQLLTFKTCRKDKSLRHPHFCGSPPHLRAWGTPFLTEHAHWDNRPSSHGGADQACPLGQWDTIT